LLPHVICGKIAARKTRQIAAECKGVLISEDVWLSRLYAEVYFDLND
jgi:hypothetical protein